MIETWGSMLSQGEKIGIIVMDLSKAFYTLHHNLLLCKLTAYGFDANVFLIDTKEDTLVVPKVLSSSPAASY